MEQEPSRDTCGMVPAEGGTALLMMLIALFAIGLMAMVIAQVASTELAIKLANGATLGAATTIVSENPLYVEGSFNIANKKGAAIIGDAVTILSNNRGDTNGDGLFDSDLDYSLLDLDNLPPATPRMYLFTVTSWEHR